jgi:alpha-L-fucosidase
LVAPRRCKKGEKGKPEERMNYEERIRWFQKSRFGMFVHWGLYALLGRSEWVMYRERISAREYAKLAWEFNPPEKFSPGEWVKLAIDAGMKYMVFTTRHHDGFCLFDSHVSDFTSVKTAAKRDFVAEYVDACRKHGMRIGLYYSLLDWRFPGFFDKDKYPDSFNAMVEQFHGQVKELMTNYGEIDILWYDGHLIPGVDVKDVAKLWRSREINNWVRGKQPAIIINNRSGLDEDIDTPEQHVTASRTGRAWESCMTIGDFCGWGYVRHNLVLKTVPELIQNLAIAAHLAGNFLLNVGPKPDGSVQKEFVARLKTIGKWMHKNGESIYGSEKTEAVAGFIATTRGHTLYLHVFRWPGREAVVPGIKNNVLSVQLLATGRPVRFEKIPAGTLLLRDMPSAPPDKNGTVIAVECDGRPEIADYSRIPL